MPDSQAAKMAEARATALAQNPELLKQLLIDGLDALPSGLALFDAEDRVIVTNQMFRIMLPSGAALLDAGARFPEMARHNAITYFGIPEDEVDAWLERRVEYHNNPEGAFDQQLADGRWFRVEESRTSNGGTMTNWTDITDLKIQEQVAENYADALMTTNQQLEEFAHIASHDLQEPLRKIEVFGGRLAEKCSAQLDESGHRYLDRMIDATGRMRRLIADLLDFAKITDSRDDFEPVALDKVLAEVLDTLEFRIQETGAIVEADDLPMVPGDFGQLCRLFQNLLSNAIKYVAEGTQPRLAVSLVSCDDIKVELAFRDNGIGFDQSDAEKIFEVFQRLHGRGGGYEGTGIGLASCRKITDQHGGEIRAESARGEGTTFFVVLPLDTRI